MVTWSEVEKKYGKELSDKMSKSQYLECITVTLAFDGTWDYPERDIDLAYRDIMKLPISSLEWD
jgi:hypothetical protein